jgi:DNA polymerase-3 subunit epsilon
MRQIALDTETTGIDTRDGHRIIEIGCVEIIDRARTGRHYHQYINPEREVDQGAYEVHGLSNEFLSDKPVFAEVVDEFLRFVDGAELVIHNAPFDVGFIDYELGLLGADLGNTARYCQVLDTLALARKMHPGMRNSLDALCKRYEVDNTGRTLHGALLDAELLADMFLNMTGGQVSLSLAFSEGGGGSRDGGPRVDLASLALPSVAVSAEAAQAHQAYLQKMAEETGTTPVWLQDGSSAPH